MELQWPLILFTFFLCLCGGILGFQGLLAFLGKGKKMQMVSLIAGFIALVIGGISVFTHLQHWERIFNGFSALIVGKGEYGISGIGLEMWGCVIFAIAVVLYFLFMKRSESGIPPKWIAVVAMVVGVALPAVTGDSYLMAALPTWDTPLLIVYYVLNTVVMGSCASLIIARCVGEEDDTIALLKKICFWGVAVQTLVVIIFAFYISSLGASWTNVEYYFDPTLPDLHMVDEVGRTGIVAGDKALAFWLGAVIVGGIAPLVLLWIDNAIKNILETKVKLQQKQELPVSIATAVCIVAGGIIWRCILYLVAISAFALYSNAI